MTKRAVLETYGDLLERMTDELLDVIAAKAGDGLVGRAVRTSAKQATKGIKSEMQKQGRVLVEYTAARLNGEGNLSSYRREFLRTNPVYTRYEGPRAEELESELLSHLDRAADDLAPLVASDSDDFWEALAEEYDRTEADAIIERHFSQAETFKQYRDGIFSSGRLGDLVIDVVETGEERLKTYIERELDRVYGA